MRIGEMRTVDERLKQLFEEQGIFFDSYGSISDLDKYLKLLND